MANSGHIQITTTPPRVQYIADGVQSLFVFPFPIFDANNLQVFVDGLLQSGTYTTAGVGASHGGSVGFLTPPPAGARITIRRQLPVQRTSDFQEGGDFRAKTLNDELDYQTAAMQQIESDVIRGLRLPPADPDVDTTLPDSQSRAGKVLAFDAAGAPVTLAPSANLPDDASDRYVTGTGLVSPRTLADRFAAMPTVLDRGAAGDGVTGDGPALAALDRPHALPKADYAVSPDELPAIRPYWLEGAGALLDPTATETPLRARHDLFNHQGTGRAVAMLAGLLPDLPGPTPDVSALARAMVAGAAKVVFVGDSITEGGHDVEPENAWAALFRQSLERAFPNVDWTFENLSLGQRDAQHLADPDYLALAAEPGDKDQGFHRAPPGPFPSDTWSGGSQLGVSWRQHVQDQAPDLVVWAHGMNNFTMTGQDYAEAVQGFYDYTRTWTKPPTVALVTTFLPTRLDPSFRAQQAAHDAHYRILRDFAALHRLPLIDANRVHHFLRDGVDEGRRMWFREDAFRAFGTNWWDFLEGDSGQVSLNSGRLVFGGTARPRRKLVAADFQADLTWRPAQGGDVLAFNYRVNPDTPTERYEFQWSGPNLRLYWKGVSKVHVVDNAATVGADNHVRVRCDGARHRVWINGALKLDAIDFESLSEGGCAYRAYLGGTGSPQIGCTLKAGYPARYARPLLHEDDLIGLGDWASNADSAGGNGLNHPSTAGHCLMYAPAFGAFVSLLRALPKPRAVEHGSSNTAISTTSTSFANTGEQVSIQAEAGELALVSFNLHVVNQSPSTNASVARVTLNGAPIAATTQYLPPTDSRGTVIAMAQIPVTLAQGLNIFALQWMSESGTHTLESKVPGRSLTVEKVG